MIIKVCGMRDAKNIRDVEALGIDWLGMIFWDKSPRSITLTPSDSGIIPDQVTPGNECNTNKVKRVGVFVDATAQHIITMAVNYKLDIIQMHGNETTIQIDNLRATLDPDIRHGIKFIKAISVTSAEDIDRYHEYEACADYFLFDTRCKTVGGSGQQFDWGILDTYHGRRPFLLSGGIGPGDAERIKALRHPMFAGIDLNSRFETAPGVKDVEALRRFVDSLRS